MNTFKPELCVNRKSKPEHYDIKDVKKFAKAAGFTSENMKLGKGALCDKLKAKYRNAGQPNRNAGQQNKNAVAGPSRVKKGKNRNKLLANRSPLLNVRKSPKVFKKYIKSCIKEQTVIKKLKTQQRTVIKKNLNKYFKNRSIIYKDIRTQLTNRQKNPLFDKYINPILKYAVLLQFGDINRSKQNNLRLELASNYQKKMPITFMKYSFMYQNYKDHSNNVIQTVKVPKIWKPSVGKSQLDIQISRNTTFLRCAINTRDKLTLDKLVYIDTELYNDKIQYFYNKTTLIAHMNKKGYCPSHKWRQLRPENIKTLHPTVLESSYPDIQGLLKIRELQKIHNNNILTVIEQMLSEVHTILNKYKVVMHVKTTRNILERRGNCGLSVMMLYDLIQEQKNKADQVELLTELGESLPVCIEAKCNFIREFVEEKKAGIKFNYNSGMPKDRIIGDACLYYIKKWCKESEEKSNSREYFLGKLPDLFTRVQAKLQNKNSKNGKIDYTDILRVILEQGEYMVNCGNHNFNNINLNTENQKRKIFGMMGII